MTHQTVLIGALVVAWLFVSAVAIGVKTETDRKWDDGNMVLLLWPVMAAAFIIYYVCLPFVMGPVILGKLGVRAVRVIRQRREDADEGLPVAKIRSSK